MIWALKVQITNSFIFLYRNVIKNLVDSSLLRDRMTKQINKCCFAEWLTWLLSTKMFKS